MTIAFLKMHGLGNDFVIVDGGDGLSLTIEQIKNMASRRYGAGCDQLLFLKKPSDPHADVFMKIYNADGSEAGACGNGTRCVARMWMDKNLRDHCTIQTAAGLLQCCRADNDMVEVNMGMPKFKWQDIPLSEEKDTLHMGIMSGPMHDPVCVNVGNPHTVFFVDDISKVDIEGLGAQVERHVLFPERTNVEFAKIMAPDKIRVRVWERGAGVTQACGSGACATMVAAVRRGLTGRKAEIILDGGALYLEWRAEDDNVLMTGPAAYVFEGVFL